MIRSIAYIIVFLTSFVFFLPKENIYFEIEHLLNKKFNITINNEKIKNNPLYLKVYDGNIYLQDMRLGSFKEFELSLLLINNTLKLTHFNVDSNFNKLTHFKDINVNLTYSIINPLYVNVIIKGDIKAKGIIDLKNRKILIKFQNPKIIKSINLNIYKNIIKNKGQLIYEF